MSKKINIPEILKENDKRNAELDKHYNPLTGEGSPLERKLFSYEYMGSLVEYLVPVSMFDDPVIQALNGSSIEDVVGEVMDDYSFDDLETLYNQTVQIRLKHDFEFYAFTCLTIPEKVTDKLIPFKLNRPQRRLLKQLEKRRLEGKPIRTIICKARQWGGSTLTQLYMNWIQHYHKTNWNMAICALVDAQALHIENMFEETAKQFPKEFGEVTLRSYARTHKNRHYLERNSIIGIGSVKNPDNLRTFNIHLAHFSEVGLWTSTPRQSAESLAQSLRGTVQNLPYTMIVMESTAKGVGNFFHREWQNAVSGKSSYDPIFVPWFEIEIYRTDIKDKEKFIKSMTDYDWFQWELGATLEGINWYKLHKSGENMDDITMFSEFPSTAEEAFSSTGRPAFNRLYVKKAEQSCQEPEIIGELRADSTKGKKALERIEFEKNPSGNLWVWAEPDATIRVANRYCVFADIGGKHKGADYSCAKVLDRYFMMEGGIPEVVAVWHGHLEQDLVAWKCAQLAKWYNNALLAVESNSLRKENKDGDHFLTVLDEIAPYYDNLFTRTDPEKVKEGVPTVWGFHTNMKTKPLLIDTLNASLRDEQYIERDRRAISEMIMYELKEDGTYGAPEGEHDDHVIITAGSVWLAWKYMDMPKLVKTKQKKGKKVINEASI